MLEVAAATCEETDAEALETAEDTDAEALET